MAGCSKAIGSRVAWVQFDGAITKSLCLFASFLCHLVVFCQAAQITVIGIKVIDGLALGPFNLRPVKFGGDHTREIERDLILQLEYVIERALKAIRPKICTTFAVDQLAADA